MQTESKLDPVSICQGTIVHPEQTPHSKTLPPSSATIAIRFASAEKVMDLMESLVRVPCETFPEDPSARYKNVEVLSNTFGNTIAHHL